MRNGEGDGIALRVNYFAQVVGKVYIQAGTFYRVALFVPHIASYVQILVCTGWIIGRYDAYAFIASAIRFYPINGVYTAAGKIFVGFKHEILTYYRVQFVLDYYFVDGYRVQSATHLHHLLGNNLDFVQRRLFSGRGSV